MDDLISEFITETAESLSVLDSELVKLEKNPDDPALLGNIFRLMHTIKGTCGFLGLPRLEHVAHAGENVLGVIRDGKMKASPEAVSLILESLDCIKGLLEHLEGEGKEPEGDDSNLIGRLNGFIESGGAAPKKQEMSAEDKEKIEAALAAQRAEEAAKAEAAFAAVPAPPAQPVAAAPPPPPARPKAVEHGLEAAKDKDKEDGKGGLSAQSIRVNLGVLETLMQMVGELVLTRNQLIQIVRQRNDTDFTAPLQRLSHITTELQEGIMKTRMQPIGNAWAKFPRLVRDLSLELGKKIELRMVGAETELDRQLLELIKDPLTHMVRNSADHGIETLEERRTAGKPETGTIMLSAYHEGGHILIEISDDGKGINIDRIKDKILKNGLASEAEIAAQTDQQLLQYIFRAGFSTAEKVTSVSGRGVGMDVVKTNIEKIGGTVDLKSHFGKGSTFQIKIPLTLAIVSVLIVEVGGMRFAIPQISVTEMVRTSVNSEHKIERINDAPVLRLRERLLPLLSLSKILGLTHDMGTIEGTEKFIVVCKVGAYDFGLIVDKVFDTEEIVVKPVAPILQDLEVYSGSTILGDGSVIMILDPNGLAKTTGEMPVASETQSLDTHHSPRAATGRQMSFLIFQAGEGAPKAVPLDVVSRLEEIDVSRIEYSNGYPVIQYRDDLMRLVALDPTRKIPKTGIEQVIVFTAEHKVLGLIVDEILDITETPLEIKLSSENEGYLGSMVISEKTTEILDIGHLFLKIFGANQENGSKRNMLRVLLVDYSPFYRNITEPFLVARGFDVVAARGGKEALDILGNDHDFDAVVTDLRMPDADGFAIARACRAHPALVSVPLIAFTADINESTEAAGREAGFTLFIPKSDRQGLARALGQNLKRSKEAAA